MFMPGFVWICVSKISEIKQKSSQNGAYFVGHRLGQSGVLFLIVGWQSTESLSKRLSSFQTIWDRVSVSEGAMDSMWPTILFCMDTDVTFGEWERTRRDYFVYVFTLGKDHTEAIADIYDNQCGFNRPPKKTLPQFLPSGDHINTENLAVNSWFT